MTMLQLVEHVDYCIKGAAHADGRQWVLIEHNGARYSRRIHYKPFSNWPVEYVRWNNKQYQVNNVKEMYPTAQA